VGEGQAEKERLAVAKKQVGKGQVAEDQAD